MWEELRIPLQALDMLFLDFQSEQSVIEMAYLALKICVHSASSFRSSRQPNFARKAWFISSSLRIPRLPPAFYLVTVSQLIR